MENLLAKAVFTCIERPTPSRPDQQLESAFLFVWDVSTFIDKSTFQSNKTQAREQTPSQYLPQRTGGFDMGQRDLQ